MKKKLFKRLLPVFLFAFGTLLVYIASLSPELVEKAYSGTLYRVIAQALSLITGIFPFSLAELAVTALTAAVIYALVRTMSLAVKGGAGRNVLPRFLFNIVTLASFIYFSFILLWGLNYHRLPFSSIAGLNVRPASVEELKKVCEYLVERTNQLRSKVEEDSYGVMQLADGSRGVFSRAYKGYDKASEIYPALGGRYGRPKGVILSHLMSYTGISGVYFPFTAEANVNTAIPDCMLPSTACHEMAHQRGFAREDEANYIAYLACSFHPDADFQYSGNLLALIHSLNALYDHDRDKFKEVRKKCSEGVARDLAALNEFWERYEGPVEDLSSTINDAYLKANMQKEGIHSYGRMVDLLIAEYRMKNP